MVAHVCKLNYFVFQFFQDPAKILRQQSESLDLVSHDWFLERAEQELLSKMDYSPTERKAMGLISTKVKSS
jgi:hypothetical protein